MVMVHTQCQHLTSLHSRKSLVEKDLTTTTTTITSARTTTTQAQYSLVKKLRTKGFSLKFFHRSNVRKLSQVWKKDLTYRYIKHIEPKKFPQTVKTSHYKRANPRTRKRTNAVNNIYSILSVPPFLQTMASDHTFTIHSRHSYLKARKLGFAFSPTV